MYWDALVCGMERWNTIWGDPWLTGTIMVLSYGLASFLALRTLRGSGRPFWNWVGGFSAFMAINTPLDLHAIPPSVGRCLAKAQGWYEDRFIVSNLVITMAVLLVLYLLYRLFRAVKGVTLPKSLAALGIAIIALWKMIRSSESHWMDAFAGKLIGPWFSSDLIEFAGIGLLLFAILLAIRTEGRGKGFRRSARP